MSYVFDIDGIVSALKSVIPAGKGPVALHEPQFVGHEWDYVKECLDTGWVSSVGQFVDRFEDQLAAYTGVKRAVAVVNGTAALHVCLQLAGVRPGDEVLAPALTFVATANALTYCGAIPHFVDSEEKSFGLDPHKLSDYLQDLCEIRGHECFNRKTMRRISAVVPMHTFGHPVDLDPLVEVCERYKLVLIEDAAESLGSYYKGEHTGNRGLLSALSFNGNKIVTTGGGGAILTNDEKLGSLAKHLTTTAKLPHKWSFRHDKIGYNYRMPNINAALGCAQLEKLPGFLVRKRQLADRYLHALSEIPGIRFATEPHYARSNYWLNVLMLDEPGENSRDQLLEATNEAGMLTRPTWDLMDHLPMYESCPKMPLDCAEDLSRKLICLPSSSDLVSMTSSSTSERVN